MLPYPNIQPKNIKTFLEESHSFDQLNNEEKKKDAEYNGKRKQLGKKGHGYFLDQIIPLN